jgi:hypothetical protein
MKNLLNSTALAFGLVMLSVGLVMAATTLAYGYELTGYVSVEGTIFTSDALQPEQEGSSASLALSPELYHVWENGSALTFAPYARLDNVDPERTHFDIRELNYLLFGETWELRLGVDKVFWGTTEFVHLVDIINQTDLVEGIDGEEKLGQPMVHLALVKDWGVIDMFALPYFRERTFPGLNGRPRFGLHVDMDHPVYESVDKERHMDYAVRYSHYLGILDFGITHFSGTGREPTLLPGTDSGGQPVLIPFYELIEQTGIDLQVVAGEWLLKLEAIARTGQGEDYSALTGGFEYTIVGLGGSAVDLGVVGEYAYDDRGDTATTPYEDDLMMALRLTFNDQAGSELLAGLAQDQGSSARVMSVEASRRFGSSVTASLQAYAFMDLPIDDPLYSMRDDDFVKLEIAYYF